VEKDYDQKAAELLKRFEKLELQRIQTSQERLVDFFVSWQMVRGGKRRREEKKKRERRREII
jgi:hypothetical protein